MSDSQLTFHGRTDIGIVRDHNEDAFGFFLPEGQAPGDSGATGAGGDLIAVLSDGVGGHEAGELASNATVAGVGAVLSQMACELDPDDMDRLRPRVEKAMAGLNANMRSVARHRGQGQKNMAATLTSVWLAVGRINMVHAGDSRLYRWRQGRLEQLSVDDTIAGRAIAAGKMTETEGREDKHWHVLQRAMGIDERKFGVTVQSWAVADGDTYLLCSDGLTDGLTNTQLEKGFARFDAAEPAAFCERLIEAGNQASGKDNITVCLLQVGEGWVAASQNPENRNFFNSRTMQAKTPKFLPAVLALLTVCLLVSIFGLYQLSQSTQQSLEAIQAQQALQAQQAQAYEARIEQVAQDMKRIEADLAEDRESSTKAMAQLWHNFETSVQDLRESMLLATDQSVQKFGEKMESTQAYLEGKLQEARDKAGAVSGQLSGVRTQLDQYKEDLDALRVKLIQKLTPPETLPAEPVTPSVDETGEVIESVDVTASVD